MELLLLNSLGLLVALPIAILSWRQAARLGHASVIVRALLLYVGLAHLAVGVAISTFGLGSGSETATNELTVDQLILTIKIIVVYSIVVIGCCLQLTFIHGPTRTLSAERPLPYAKSDYFVYVGAAILFILALKYLVNHVMGWGVPALLPTNTIPLVTGFSVYLVRDGVLCLLAMALYEYYYSSVIRPFKQKLLLISLLLGALISDFLIGSKFIMMGLIFVLAPIMLRRFNRLPFNKKVSTIVVALILSIPFLGVYHAANVLRFINLDTSLSSAEIFLRVVEKLDVGADLLNIIYPVLARITGAEGVALATTMIGELKATFSDILFPSDFGTRYTFAVSGIDAENLAIGATLAGTYSLACGGELFCIGVSTYLVTFLSLAAVVLIARKIALFPAVRYGVSTSLALLMVHLQMASGGILSFSNRIFVIVIVGYIMGRYLRERSRSTLRHRNA